MGEGRGVKIQMCCERKPGLLLSTMRALDNLGIDIHQAVITYFNGFAMDILRAQVNLFLFFNPHYTSNYVHDYVPTTFISNYFNLIPVHSIHIIFL